MTDEPDLESTSLTERVVLLGVASLTDGDESSVHSGMVVRTCAREFDDIRGDVLGKLSEADAVRSLNRLEADGLLDEDDGGDTSPVGKGRPRYRLTVDRETVLDTFAEDDRLRDVVARIREQEA